jgi:hypothetical protein
VTTRPKYLFFAAYVTFNAFNAFFSESQTESGCRINQT